MRVLKKILIRVIPKKLRTFLAQHELNSNKSLTTYTSISYAQEGEDLILNRFFKDKGSGFYVDIGAHHPKRFSNTFYFYKKGWKGINVDAMPDVMALFNEQRPRDINLELGVSKQQSELIYYMFNEPALNTFSEIEAKRKDGLRNFKIIQERSIQTYPLVEILDQYVEANQKIDFISIDVEGLDLEVINSNDWDKYRPEMILVEDLRRHNLSEVPTNSRIYQVLASYDYEFVAKTVNTMFFKNKR